MANSIFTKILNKEIPGEVIYQDDKCFVILTVQPLTPGHMLVIPRVEVDHLWDVDDDTYTHLFHVARDMQARLARAYPSYKRIGLLVEGFGVPHAHIHVFGYDEPIEPTLTKHIEWKKTLASGMVSQDALKEPAEKLRAA